MAYLTIVDQVMPYHGKVLNLPQTKNDCLKNILLTAINLFQTPRLDFFIAIVRYYSMDKYSISVEKLQKVCTTLAI